MYLSFLGFFAWLCSILCTAYIDLNKNMNVITRAHRNLGLLRVDTVGFTGGRLACQGLCLSAMNCRTNIGPLLWLVWLCFFHNILFHMWQKQTDIIMGHNVSLGKSWASFSGNFVFNNYLMQKIADKDSIWNLSKFLLTPRFDLSGFIYGPQSPWNIQIDVVRQHGIEKPKISMGNR